MLEDLWFIWLVFDKEFQILDQLNGVDHLRNGVSDAVKALLLGTEFYQKFIANLDESLSLFDKFLIFLLSAIKWF